MINAKLRNRHFFKMKEHNEFSHFMNTVFVKIYDWLHEHHPKLFVLFIMVVLPILSVLLLLLTTLICMAPFIFILGW